MTNMQEKRQNTLLLYREVFIHVITEMTKLPSWGLYFYFKLDSILNVTLVSLCLFLSFSFFSFFLIGQLIYLQVVVCVVKIILNVVQENTS